MQFTQRAHEVVRHVIVPGDVAIDATVGNGFDLLFLAQQVGHRGHVYGFDIQAAALRLAERKLDSSPVHDACHSAMPGTTLSDRVTLHRACHSSLLARLAPDLQGRIAAVMFNLGYLPHGDHTIVTHPNTTVSAIAQSIELLRPGGVITVLAYPGHDGGQIEVDAVIGMMATADNDAVAWQEHRHGSINPVSPRLFSAHRN